MASIIVAGYFLVLGQAPTSIPEKFPTKESCVAAAQEMMADYDASNSSSLITRWRFACVRSPT